MKAQKMPKADGPRVMKGVRLSDEEWTQIKKAARRLKMSASEFMRGAALVQAKYTLLGGKK